MAGVKDRVLLPLAPSEDAFGLDPTPAEVRDFAAFYRQHLSAAVRLAYLLCGQQALAEDAVADAFARMYPHWLHGTVDNSWSYLRRAVLNEVRNRHRHRRVERREERRFTVAPSENAPIDQMADRDRLVAALAALPPRQRAAVVLRYYGDMSEAAAAEALGISTGSVKSSVSRGLARLRGLLGEE
ncbi:MAG TPA: SigE family RNA polymerase sigma factor [Acidimicrobiales bacterium]|jgi:RNA polymerase sigma-70 factor (sigma-E family)|nr:SigE family RNA polymerase sigma factor [Acidimicrobiales bacterium]